MDAGRFVMEYVGEIIDEPEAAAVCIGGRLAIGGVVLLFECYWGFIGWQFVVVGGVLYFFGRWLLGCRIDVLDGSWLLR